jgi:hypothetical protein
MSSYRFLIILLNLLVASCSVVSSTKESPVIYFSNASSESITDIRCIWAQKNILTLPELTPGLSRSQSFYIKGGSDFFGIVRIEWYNSQSEKMVKEFNFTKDHMLDFDDPTAYNYVQLYFDQEDVEVVTSDIVDLSGKTRKMERLLTAYSTAYAQRHSKAQTSLISVQHPQQRDSSLPSWLSNSY